MNIFNKALLWVFLLPRALYDKLGVSMPQLRSILTVKLTMDDRRPGMFQQLNQQKANAPVTKATLVTMGFSVFIGCSFLMVFFLGSDAVTHVGLFFALFMFMLSVTLISDFTQVLIDVRDNQIILPKPVSDRTVVTARILHIGIHMSKLMLPMALPALILVGIRVGPVSVIALLLCVLMATVFSLFLINAMYLLILKFSSPQKFKQIITYLQIGFAILFYGGFQLLPRLVEKDSIGTLALGNVYGHILLPPYWFAAFFGLLNGIMPVSWVGWAAAILAVLAPVAGIVLVVRFFAPLFNQKLSLLSGDSPSTSKPVEANAKASGKKANYWAQWITRPGAERMGFLFCQKMMARSREFKLKVYPSIGYVVVLVLAQILRQKNFSFDNLEYQTQPGNMFFIMYAPFLVSLGAIGQINNTNHFKASWLFNITPLSHPGAVLCGTIKAILVGFLLPCVAMTVLLGCFRFSPALFLQIGVACCVQVALVYVFFWGQGLMFPFSQPPQTAAQRGSILVNMVLMLLLGACGLLHYALRNHWWACVLLAVAAVGAAVAMHKKTYHVPWKRIKLYSDF
ncbi:MAG: hypothetical protein EAY75_02605 [Bacteroidetes bacterium]|nr:MAG: hypothetical protein EAY75_02605 [Bacteroidota bacterium]